MKYAPAGPPNANFCGNFSLQNISVLKTPWTMYKLESVHLRKSLSVESEFFLEWLDYTSDTLYCESLALILP